MVAEETDENLLYALYLQINRQTGSSHRIRERMNPTIWYAKRKGVLKFQASAMGSC